MQGGQTVLNYYGMSLIAAVNDLFPSVDFDAKKFHSQVPGIHFLVIIY